MNSSLKTEINNSLRNIGVIVFFFLIIGTGYFLFTGKKVFDSELKESLKQSKIINRIDLLTCDGEIYGTYYFFDSDQQNDRGWVSGSHARFIDYRGRKIQFSSNYVVTPIPDTVSTKNHQ